MQIKNAWARPGGIGSNSAVYFIIENPTGQNDLLLSASTDIARFVELHMSAHDEHGTAKMMLQESVDIPSSNTVEFKPGGLHVMLIDLKDDLKIGDQFTLTLSFDQNGSIVVDVNVESH